MGRILAIDYGTKRVGIAVTDSLKLIASGLTTVHSEDIIDFLKDYFEKEEVECIVVGEPRSLDGGETDSSIHVRGFVNKLTKVFTDKEIISVDERFTSKMAAQSLIDSGVPKKKRQNKELIDEVSAIIILQSYLEMMEK